MWRGGQLLKSLAWGFNSLKPPILTIGHWGYLTPGVDKNENFSANSTSIFPKNFHNNGININTLSSNLQYQSQFQYYHMWTKTSKQISILSTVFWNISMGINISRWILQYHNDFNNFKLFEQYQKLFQYCKVNFAISI